MSFAVVCKIFLSNSFQLRYIDTPSSLAISSIADQQEVVVGLGIVPFFTSAGAGDKDGSPKRGPHIKIQIDLEISV